MGCVVDLKNNILSIRDEEVPLQRLTPTTVLPCYRVLLDQTVELPPQSESLVPVRVEGLQPTIGRWGILEPGGDGLHGIAGVLAGRTLVDLLKPTVPVRLLNLAEKEQRIKKGTAIAVCAAVQSIMPGKDCSRWQHTEDLPEHLRDLYRRSSENLTPAQKAQVHNLLCQFSDVFSRIWAKQRRYSIASILKVLPPYDNHPGVYPWLSSKMPHKLSKR